MDSTLSRKLKLSAEQNTTNARGASNNEDTSLHIGQVITPTVDIKQAMTSILLTEESVVEDKIPNQRVDMPFYDQTPTAILTRMYETARFSMGSGTDFNFNADALFAQSAIKRVITMFSLIRFGLRVRIVLNCVPQQYGVVRIGKVPLSWTSSNAQGRWEWGSANPVLLDIASSQSCEFVLPFIYPAKFMPVYSQATADEYGLLASMWYLRMSTLRFQH
jgi:hypothetical protein